MRWIEIIDIGRVLFRNVQEMEDRINKDAAGVIERGERTLVLFQTIDDGFTKYLVLHKSRIWWMICSSKIEGLYIRDV